MEVPGGFAFKGNKFKILRRTTRDRNAQVHYSLKKKSCTYETRTKRLGLNIKSKKIIKEKWLELQTPPVDH